MANDRRREGVGAWLKWLWDTAPIFAVRYLLLISGFVGVALTIQQQFGRIVATVAAALSVSADRAYIAIVASVFVCIVAFAAAKSNRSGGRLYGVTLALVFRIAALAAFAAYAYRQPQLWWTVGLYGGYVIALVLLVVRPAYHSHAGRQWRNIADMAIGVLATQLDQYLLAPTTLLLLIPLMVGGKYLWIGNSVLTIAVPLFVYSALTSARIHDLVASASINASSAAADAAPRISAFGTFATCLGLMLMIVVAYFFERYANWRPYVHKIRDFTQLCTGASTFEQIGQQVASRVGARACAVYVVGSHGQPLGVAGTPAGADAGSVVAMLRAAPDYGEAGASAVSWDRRIAIVVSDRDPRYSSNNFFSHEDALFLEIAANVISSVKAGDITATLRR